jgi:KDO2-lipid IV(A) lauroyltransferase
MQKTNAQIRKGIRRILSFIPLPVLYGLSHILFYILYYLGRYRRRITRKNLVESFPEKSPEEILAIEKRFYRFFVDTLFEMTKMASFSEQEMRRRMKFTNLDEVRQILENGKSISVFIGHYGNWEWICSLPLHLPKQIIAGQIYHRLSNRFFDSLMLRNRSRWGAYSVEMHQTSRWIHARTQQGQVTITGYITDQAPGRGPVQHHVRFLNHRTPAITGPEKITQRYGFDAYYLDVKCNRRGYYEACFVRMNKQDEHPSDFALTDRYYQLLEKTIRDHPEYYLWTHNRFKRATTKISEANIENQ